MRRLEAGAEAEPFRRPMGALPTPAEAKVIVPDFAAAASSCTVLMPFEGAITITFGTLPNEATAAKSFAVS